MFKLWIGWENGLTAFARELVRMLHKILDQNLNTARTFQFYRT